MQSMKADSFMLSSLVNIGKAFIIVKHVNVIIMCMAKISNSFNLKEGNDYD